MANLRIIYNNLIDLGGTSLTASSSMSTAVPVTNLENDLRGRVWKSATSSTTAVKTMLLATFSAVKTVTGIVLVNTNHTPAATMTVRGYTGTPPTLGGTTDTPTITGGTLEWTEGPTLCCPPAPDDGFSWGGQDLNAYHSSETNYSRIWIPSSNAQVSTIVIEMNDTGAGTYMSASRLIVGNYWSPKYNTGYGMQSDYKDMSRSERTESGALITNVGSRYAVMQFSLDWMEDKDRIELNRLNRVKGTSGSIFVSLFPDQSDNWNLEQMYQIYGRLSNTLPVTHPMYSFYSSQMEIEEV